ncbi:ERF family protein, partial [Pseudomonas shirazica]|uniref:ERF family protein n=1 Tax=Pseudomonas shirazica TaxID=1940636 RepID=UPI0035242E3C
TFEDINDIVKPIMQRFGFAVSFRVETVQTGVSVTGILMHCAGHREQTTMLVPIDTSGSKNAVQSLGSSVSYGKRYV